MKLVVDGIDRIPGMPARTWGELLARLDDECAKRGVVISDVSFDGQVQEAFRTTPVVTRQIGQLRIEVKTSTQTDLLLTAIDEAIGAAEPMCPVAAQLAAAFRAHDLARANQDLAIFAPNLGALVQLASNISTLAARLNERAQNSEVTAVPAAIGKHVDVLIEAQSSGDWITVADVLEYDITQSLGSCIEGLRGVRAALAAA